MGGAQRGRPKWRGCTRSSSRPVAATLGSGVLPRVVGVACFRVAWADVQVGLRAMLGQGDGQARSRWGGGGDWA
jgi:hypothetical protein